MAALVVPSRRILVVDDNRLLRSSVSRHLGRRGYEVSSCESGEEALGLIAQQAPDLVLLDLELPGICGRVTLAEAQRLRPGLPVLFLTAASLGAEEAVSRGALGLLAKPFRFDELDSAVDRALRTPGP